MNIIITDDNGMPIGSMDPEKVQNDGTDLAFQLAAYCGDERRTQQTLTQALQQHGPQGVGYVLTAAISCLTDDILSGAFDVMAAATGTDPRGKMLEIANTTYEQFTAESGGE